MSNDENTLIALFIVYFTVLYCIFKRVNKTKKFTNLTSDVSK